jgi:hypothetical protein
MNQGSLWTAIKLRMRHAEFQQTSYCFQPCFYRIHCLIRTGDRSVVLHSYCVDNKPQRWQIYVRVACPWELCLLVSTPEEP